MRTASLQLCRTKPTFTLSPHLPCPVTGAAVPTTHTRTHRFTRTYTHAHLVGRRDAEAVPVGLDHEAAQGHCKGRQTRQVLTQP